MAKLVVHNRAAQYIKRMDARIKAQLFIKLEQLAKSPIAMPVRNQWLENGWDFTVCATAISESSIFTIGPTTRSLSLMWGRGDAYK